MTTRPYLADAAKTEAPVPLAFAILLQAIRDVQQEDHGDAIAAEIRRHEHAKARIADRLELMAECLDHADNMRYLESGSHAAQK